MPDKESQPIPRRAFLRKGLAVTAGAGWVGTLVGLLGVMSSEPGVSAYREQHPTTSASLSDLQVDQKIGAEGFVETSLALTIGGIAVLGTSLGAREIFTAPLKEKQSESAEGNNNPDQSVGLKKFPPATFTSFSMPRIITFYEREKRQAWREKWHEKK